LYTSYPTIAHPYPRPAMDSCNTNFHWSIQWSKLTVLFVAVSCYWVPSLRCFSQCL